MEQGLIIKSTGSWHTVLDSRKNRIDCKIKGKLRTLGIRNTNPVAVGDIVQFIRDKGGQGIITSILQRKNYIIRKASNLSKETHILAANIDQAIVVVTLAAPRTTLKFIDRFLATSEAYNIRALIVFNKTDLYNKILSDEHKKLTTMYESIGYQTISTSATTMVGVDSVKQQLSGKISLFAGNSGVGKSTLINLIDPSLDLKTAKLSNLYETGKHTTTFSEMFELTDGGFIIDTPGIKGFGVFNFDKNEIFHFFPEIFKVSNKCRYYNCMHFNEPGCAVKELVEKGKIGQSRYESYISIYEEDGGKYRVTKY